MTRRRTARDNSIENRRQSKDYDIRNSMDTEDDGSLNMFSRSLENEGLTTFDNDDDYHCQCAACTGLY